MGKKKKKKENGIVRNVRGVEFEWKKKAIRSVPERTVKKKKNGKPDK